MEDLGVDLALLPAAVHLDFSVEDLGAHLDLLPVPVAFALSLVVPGLSVDNVGADLDSLPVPVALALSLLLVNRTIALVHPFLPQYFLVLILVSFQCFDQVP